MYGGVFRIEKELLKLGETMKAEGKSQGEKLEALASHPPG